MSAFKEKPNNATMGVYVRFGTFGFVAAGAKISGKT